MKPEVAAEVAAHLTELHATHAATDSEKIYAIASLLEELPELVKTDEYGFARHAGDWEASIRRGLIAAAQSLIERNE